uniref:Reverse transcriptase domain-containing protein n=1 Tax=Gouania willdenowi TaxID=441366 RepID=A0A8C5I3C7_GOUWI
KNGAATTASTRCALVNARSVANKTFILQDFFTSCDLDVLFLTETWINSGESTAFSELLPPDCTFINVPRTTGRGGGIATVLKNCFYHKVVSERSFSSFELSYFELRQADPVLCAVIYRPPKHNKDFIRDFYEFVACVLTRYDRVLIVGDFNVHVCCPSKPMAREFLDLVEAFNLTQHVTGPTQVHGHTLDIVLSCGFPVNNVVVGDAVFSDHSPVMFDLILDLEVKLSCVRHGRVIKPDTAAAFSPLFTASFLDHLNSAASMDTEQLMNSFTSTCSEVLDSVAPLRAICPKPKQEPWLNDTTRTARRECRRAERRWKKDHLEVSHQILRECWRNYQSAVKTEKTQYFSNLISNNVSKPRVLFKTIGSVFNPSPSTSLEMTSGTCEKFLSFFNEKVAAIRANISPFSVWSCVSTQCLAVFSQFESVSLSVLTGIVKKLKPSSCPTDPVPPRFFKEVWDTIGSSVREIINSSLATGIVPAFCKKAVVEPLIKKPGLDPANLANYRPISKLPLVSKILEKCVFAQLQPFLDENGTLDPYQSGYKALHSTESALLKVFNDLFLMTDSGGSAILVLLDLTAAFDTVDHTILLDRLRDRVGVRGTALEWFRSYLSERSFSVRLGDSTSSSAPLHCGVPQGSILGPILFAIYLLPLGEIFKKHGMSYHFYADDCQIYLPIAKNDHSPLTPLLHCLGDVKAWLAQNFLKLNEGKTEIMAFGCTLTDLGSLQKYLHPKVTSLGVTIDSDFKFDKQINGVLKSGFYHLRLLSKVKPFLSFNLFEQVVHAFISSRLDYCNALYSGISQKALYRLQLVQNAAARLLTGTKKREHITPILASLHWLPVKFRIDFKILLFVFKAWNGLAPQYITDLIQIYRPQRALRSEGQLQLVVPKANRKTKGDRAFSVVGPKLWNALPLHIRTAPTVECFKSRLKTHFYSLAFSTA